MLDDGRRTRSSLCGKPLVADCSGALYWPAETHAAGRRPASGERLASYAPRGALLPPYDTRETLARLAGRHRPLRAGPGHRAGRQLPRPRRRRAHGARRSGDPAGLQEDRDWIWLAGNHDPAIAARAGGHVADELEIAGLTLRHAPAPGAATHEIAGHLHPAAKLSMYGNTIRRPCFVGNGRRLVMPAFGAFTGGLNVLDPAFSALFPGGDIAVWMLGRARLYPVATRALSAD